MPWVPGLGPPPGLPGLGLGGAASVVGGGVVEGPAASGIWVPISALGGNFVVLSAFSPMSLVALAMKFRQIVLGMPLPQIVAPFVSVIGFSSFLLPTQTAAAIFLSKPTIH